MKFKTTWILAVIVGLVSLGRTEPAPGVAEFDKSTAELTASLLLERLQNDVLNADPDAKSLETEMTAKPEKYIDPDASKTELESNFRDGIASRYREEALKYLDRLAGESGRTAMFSDTFLKTAIELPTDKLTETVSRTYPDAFRSARGDVCKKQAAIIISGIQPTEKEFEETPRDKLTDILTGRVAAAQNGPVYKENLFYISEQIVKPMLADAESQRNAQRSFVERQPVDGWTPLVIGQALQAGVTKFVAESAPRLRDEGKVTYGLFPSVSVSIGPAAENRAYDKISRVVDETVVPVDSASILTEIEGHPLDHKNAADSLKAFAPQMEEKLRAEALVRCSPLVPEEEKAAFSTFAATAMNAGRINEAISNRVRNVLLPQIKAIREECAQRQLVKLFPDIVSGKWCPSGALVDAVCAQVDYRKAVKGWPDFAEMESFAVTSREQPLMHETEKKLDDAVVAVFDRGRKAQTRQHGIVDDVFDEMKTQLSAEKELPVLDAAVALYAEKVLGIWGGERDKVLWGDDAEKPENADVQHAELFPSTMEMIRLKVKSLLESIEKERQEEVQPVNTPTDSSAPEVPELIKLDCRFEFDQKNSAIELKFYSGGTERTILRCPNAPSDYRREYRKTIDQAVSALVTEVSGLTAKGSKVELKVDIQVKNDLVYYGIVARLSNVLTTKSAELSETGVAMEVKDGMME